MIIKYSFLKFPFYQNRSKNSKKFSSNKKISHPIPRQFNSNPTKKKKKKEKFHSNLKTKHSPSVETISFDFRTTLSPEAYYYPWPNKFPSTHHPTLTIHEPLLLPFSTERERIPLSRWPTSKFHVLGGKAENLMAPWILWSRIEHDRTPGCRECRKRQKSNDRKGARRGGRGRSHSRHVENSARITFKPTVGLFCSGIPDPAFCNSLISSRRCTRKPLHSAG